MNVHYHTIFLFGDVDMVLLAVGALHASATELCVLARVRCVTRSTILMPSCPSTNRWEVQVKYLIQSLKLQVRYATHTTIHVSGMSCKVHDVKPPHSALFAPPSNTVHRKTHSMSL